ncbi:MAG: hypothetical protein J7647_05545 [Cyanobacteria bacterium SBLK]|nr:hypothetical protein [Cyanobacteria bacterium SBLK]
MTNSFKQSTIALLLIVSSLSSLARPARADAAIPMTVLACLSNPYCAVSVVLVGGYLYWQLRDSRNLIIIPVPVGVNPHSVLTDPEENVDDWDEPVYADSIEEARRKCEALQRAYNRDRPQVILSNVRKASRNPRSRTYLCVWTPVR